MPFWLRSVEVAAHDAAFEDFQGFDGIDAGAEPVAGIGAGAHTRVAVFDEGEHVIGVPELVVGVVGLFGVVVNTEVGVEFP